MKYFKEDFISKHRTAYSDVIIKCILILAINTTIYEDIDSTWARLKGEKTHQKHKTSFLTPTGGGTRGMICFFSEQGRITASNGSGEMGSEWRQYILKARLVPNRLWQINSNCSWIRRRHTRVHGCGYWATLAVGKRLQPTVWWSESAFEVHGIEWRGGDWTNVICGMMICWQC